MSAFTSAMSSFFGSKGMQNLGRSFTGNAVKAVLCIRDPETALKENDHEKKNTAEELKGAIEDVVSLNKELSGMAENSLTGRAGSSTFSDICKALNPAGIGDGEKRKYIALEVQFNPSSLRMNTSAGMQTVYGEDSTDPTMQTVRKPAATELYFELLFDEVSSQDAFMLEGNAITNTSVGNVYQAVKSGIKGKHSVQRQMEGLLAMITLDSARHVIFFWADMCFRGEVTALSTTYTMFNKSGYPVRGKVGMTIRQGDSSHGATEAMFKYDEDYWKKAFNRLFKDDKDAASGLDTFNKFANNNLVNLKL